MGLYVFVSIGSFLAAEDPLAPADAVFVYAGTLAERPLEAADLYKAGRAPRIVLTRAREESAVLLVRERGVAVPDPFEMTKQILAGLGVPDGAIVAPARIHDNTAEEAATLRELAVRHGWQKVIAVSSKYHLRRVALASRRAVRGNGIEVIVRASRYDPSAPERWWTRRSDIRTVASEVPKLIAYALGFGGG